MKRMNFAWLGASLLLVGMPLSNGCDKDDDGADGSDDADGDDADDDTDDGSDGDDTDDGDDADGECPGIDPDAAAGEGDACTDNEDCNTGVCLLYQDVPAPDDAVCGPIPDGCSTRITATVKDFVTGEILTGETVGIVPALSAATNPAGAPRIISGESDANGRIDLTSPNPLDASVGVVALVGTEEDAVLTATGVAEPESGSLYAPGVSIHEVWSVDDASLTAWSDALESDSEASGHLPLGASGGVVGMMRDLATGSPVAGVELVPSAGSTAAIIRYLESDGTFNSDATSETGIFVVLNPSLAEKFVAEMDGVEVQDGEGTVGSAVGAVFTLVMNVTP